jgi:hypothetical protein
VLLINSFYHPKKVDAIKLLKDTYIGNITEMKIVAVTEAEIISTMTSLATKKLNRI